MPKCKACEHPDRKAIDKALLSGESLANVAGRFGLTKSCVHNHSTQHMKPSLAIALERKEEKVIARTAEWVDAKLNELMAAANDIRSRAMGKDDRLALLAMEKEIAILRDIRGITDRVTVNVQVNNIELSDEEALERAKRLVAGT